MNSQAQHVLTPVQLAMMEQVGATVISEHGDYIAFTKIVPADPFETNERSTQELYLYDVNEDKIIKVETEARISQLTYRPGQGRFTFVMNIDDEDPALYELQPDRQRISKIFSYESSIISYEWHPSGTVFAFITREDLDLPENPLPYEPEVYEEYLPNREGYIVELRGRRSPRQHKIEVEGSLYELAWSPSGDRLAISETPTPHIDDYYMFQQVKIIDGKSGSVVAEIDNKGKLGQITWSPDGNTLALRAGNSIHDPIDGRIMVVDADGGVPTNIYPDYEGKFEQISWSTDGRIRFIASESTARLYGSIRPDGTDFQTILDKEGPMLVRFGYASAGTTAFAVQTPAHPTELYIMKADENVIRRVTNSNTWLEEVAMGRQEVVRYSARDGRTIDGLLIYPVEEHGGPYPTIVMVHGGPEAHYSNGWLTGYSLPGQVAAGKGMAIFYPNYRGSTGRGIEFIKSSQGDLAGAEFDDIVDGVDYLIEQGITDGSRVGVTGGSYGGYATAWMSTRYSERFAAGVMFVGISNNLSKWGTSDIPEELYLVHSRKRLWDHWQWNLERSPVYHVDNAQTPLLIMHGSEDTRVHPGQSLELYRHIKVRKPDVPLRLIWYPDEGHGNVRSTSRFDYNLRMLRWFETYLMSDEQVKPEFYFDFEALGIDVP